MSLNFHQGIGYILEALPLELSYSVSADVCYLGTEMLCFSPLGPMAYKLLKTPCKVTCREQV